MLRRARPRTLAAARLRVPVVDAEALVGLKLQALVNAPSRRAREKADITPIVGRDVRDQQRLRATPRIRTLDEFVRFLAQLEEVFGRVASRREPTAGDCFRL